MYVRPTLGYTSARNTREMHSSFLTFRDADSELAPNNRPMDGADNSPTLRTLKIRLAAVKSVHLEREKKSRMHDRWANGCGKRLLRANSEFLSLPLSLSFSLSISCLRYARGFLLWLPRSTTIANAEPHAWSIEHNQARDCKNAELSIAVSSRHTREPRFIILYHATWLLIKIHKPTDAPDWRGGFNLNSPEGRAIKGARDNFAL